MTQQRKQTILDAVERAGGYLAADRALEALCALKSLDVRVEEAPDIYYVQASIAICLEVWEEALTMLTDLTRVVPDKPNVHMDRVKCLIELGRLEEARKVLEGEGAPLADYPPRSLLLARIAAQQGDLSQTVEWLKQACEPDRTALARMIGGRASVAARVASRDEPLRYN